MTKQKFIFWIVALLTILLAVILIATRWTATAVNPNSEKIAELTFQLSELQFQKLECRNNLSYNETKADILWIERYCVEYDEQIMLIQSQIDELSERKIDEEIKTEERTPWKLNEEWTAQEMPNVEWNDSHEKFKSLALKYWLDAWMIRQVENHYWIREWVILCITVAETSWWNRWAWWKNIWSVWSNDRWDRPTFALMESWLEAIWKTLNNQYLWKKQTLWCLSNAWSCQEMNDNWKRYATSKSSREKNMTSCLWTIYWKIDPASFSIRR